MKKCLIRGKTMESTWNSTKRIMLQSVTDRGGTLKAHMEKNKTWWNDETKRAVNGKMHIRE